jgi:serine protease Do
MAPHSRTVLLAVLLLFSGSLLWTWTTEKREKQVVLAATMRMAGPDVVSFRDGFEPIVRRVLPTVVNISTSKRVRLPLLSDSSVRQLFETKFGRVPPEIREHSLGSGVITRSDGYILTSSHVLEGCDSVTISMSDGREFDGRVVGFDPKSDLGVVKINAKYLPAADFGAPDAVRVGEFALAIGDPFGVGQTVTMGIVSATGRGGLGIEEVEHFIQTDAAINPGNSGGALVNAKGNLIGINTAIVSHRSTGAQGIGFAVPVTMARSIMDEIIATGKVVRGWLGVAVQPVTKDIAIALSLPGEAHGVLITDVERDSPARKAALREGDILLALNDGSVVDTPTFKLTLSQMKPHSTLKLKVFRDGKVMEQTVVLGQIPTGEDHGTARPTDISQFAKPGLGITAEPVTEAIKDRLQLPSDAKGIIVTDVEPEGAAAEAGLQHGDIIEELNRKPLSNVEQLQRCITSGSQKPSLLLISRAGSHMFIAIPPLTSTP